MAAAQSNPFWIMAAEAIERCGARGEVLDDIEAAEGKNDRKMQSVIAIVSCRQDRG